MPDPEDTKPRLWTISPQPSAQVHTGHVGHSSLQSNIQHSWHKARDPWGKPVIFFTSPFLRQSSFWHTLYFPPPCSIKQQKRSCIVNCAQKCFEPKRLRYADIFYIYMCFSLQPAIPHICSSACHVDSPRNWHNQLSVCHVDMDCKAHNFLSTFHEGTPRAGLKKKWTVWKLNSKAVLKCLKK